MCRGRLVRYHKDPYEERETGDFLGEEQWSWLQTLLQTSVADVHLIVSSLQVLPAPGVPGKNGEHWSRFPSARARLLQLLEDTNVAAPLLLSGDVHSAEFARATCTNGKDTAAAAKTMVEVTSSGITHSWSQLPLPMRTLMRLYRAFVPQPYGGDQHYTLDRNFAEIDFSDGGAGGDGAGVEPTVTVRIKAIPQSVPDDVSLGDAAGLVGAAAVTTPLEMTWKLSELAAGTVASCTPLRGRVAEEAVWWYKFAFVVFAASVLWVLPLTMVCYIGRRLWAHRQQPADKDKAA